MLIPIASPPTKDRRVPLFFGSPKNSYFTPIFYAIHKRLEGWSSKTLSFEGQLLLVNHVLASMPIHTLLAIPVPKCTCKDREKLIRTFLWSGDPLKAATRWDGIVCLPKSEGGLRIHLVTEINGACLLKLGWQAATSATLRSNGLGATSKKVLFGTAATQWQGHVYGEG